MKKITKKQAEFLLMALDCHGCLETVRGITEKESEEIKKTLREIAEGD